ncbi:MAG: methylated-DNA--[protein]-cysteine S-methyltransferase [Myxococcota bacterium]|nr:methylated-DNA--[protein]-cysteine S-methyltransferase [Myxococcota bacterium]
MPPRRVSSDLCAQVFKVVRTIPTGQVMSYGDVAKAIGMPRHARQVGYALSSLEPHTTVPWWRVIRTDGSIAMQGDMVRGPKQVALLKAEAVVFKGQKVDMQRHRWWPALF